jgi:hypothetical protein
MYHESVSPAPFLSVKAKVAPPFLTASLRSASEPERERAISSKAAEAGNASERVYELTLYKSDGVGWWCVCVCVCVARVSYVFIVVPAGDAPRSIHSGDCADRLQILRDRCLMPSKVVTAEWIKRVLTVLERHFSGMYGAIRITPKLCFDAKGECRHVYDGCEQ